MRRRECHAFFRFGVINPQPEAIEAPWRTLTSEHSKAFFHAPEGLHADAWGDARSGNTIRNNVSIPNIASYLNATSLMRCS